MYTLIGFYSMCLSFFLINLLSQSTEERAEQYIFSVMFNVAGTLLGSHLSNLLSGHTLNLLNSWHLEEIDQVQIENQLREAMGVFSAAGSIGAFRTMGVSMESALILSGIFMAPASAYAINKIAPPEEGLPHRRNLVLPS